MYRSVKVQMLYINTGLIMIGKNKTSEFGGEASLLAEFDVYIHRIRDVVGLPKSHFDHFYFGPLKRFLQRSRHCNKTRVIQHLECVIHALSLRRSIILPLSSDAESINAQKDVWTYVVFVASMTYRVSDLLSFHVLLKNSGSSKAVRWCPFDEAFNGTLVIHDQQPMNVKLYANLIFLSVLFDRHCLKWLYSSIDAFNAVITLSVEPDFREDLGKLILVAHKVKVPADCECVRDVNPSVTNNENFESCTERKSQDGEGVAQDSEFSDWLVASINSSVSNRLISVTKDGYALSDPSIFISYSKQYGGDWRTIKSDFLQKLGDLQRLNNIYFDGSGKSSALVIPIDKVEKLSKL